MSNPLDDLAAANRASGRSQQPQKAYPYLDSHTPSNQTLIVIITCAAVGILALAFGLWALLPSSPSPDSSLPSAPAPMPGANASPASPRALPATPRAVRSAPELRDYATVAQAMDLSAKTLPDGQIHVTGTNRSTRPIKGLTVGLWTSKPDRNAPPLATMQLPLLEPGGTAEANLKIGALPAGLASPFLQVLEGSFDATAN